MKPKLMPFFLNFLAGISNIGTATTNRTSAPKAKNKLWALIFTRIKMKKR